MNDSNLNSTKLCEIFSDIFEDEFFQLNPETNLRSIKNWDSLVLINLAVGIEKIFKVKFLAAEVYKIQTIEDVLRLLESKGISVAVPA